MQVALAGEDGRPRTNDVYGPVSLVFWTVTLVVTVKYVTLTSSRARTTTGRAA